MQCSPSWRNAARQPPDARSLSPTFGQTSLAPGENPQLQRMMLISKTMIGLPVLKCHSTPFPIDLMLMCLLLWQFYFSCVYYSCVYYSTVLLFVRLLLDNSTFCVSTVPLSIGPLFYFSCILFCYSCINRSTVVLFVYLLLFYSIFRESTSLLF